MKPKFFFFICLLSLILCGCPINPPINVGPTPDIWYCGDAYADDSISFYPTYGKVNGSQYILKEYPQYCGMKFSSNNNNLSLFIQGYYDWKFLKNSNVLCENNIIENEFYYPCFVNGMFYRIAWSSSPHTFSPYLTRECQETDYPDLSTRSDSIFSMVLYPQIQYIIRDNDVNYYGGYIATANGQYGAVWKNNDLYFLTEYNDRGTEYNRIIALCKDKVGLLRKSAGGAALWIDGVKNLIVGDPVGAQEAFKDVSIGHYNIVPMALTSDGNNFYTLCREFYDYSYPYIGHVERINTLVYKNTELMYRIDDLVCTDIIAYNNEVYVCGQLLDKTSAIYKNGTLFYSIPGLSNIRSLSFEE